MIGRITVRTKIYFDGCDIFYLVNAVELSVGYSKNYDKSFMRFITKYMHSKLYLIALLFYFIFYFQSMKHIVKTL